MTCVIFYSLFYSPAEHFFYFKLRCMLQNNGSTEPNPEYTKCVDDAGQESLIKFWDKKLFEFKMALQFVIGAIWYYTIL